MRDNLCFLNFSEKNIFTKTKTSISKEYLWFWFCGKENEVENHWDQDGMGTGKQFFQRTLFWNKEELVVRLFSRDKICLIKKNDKKCLQTQPLTLV